MSYIYNLKYLKYNIEGLFFYDKDFGYYFFTNKSNINIKEASYNLTIEDNNLILNNDGNIILKKLNYNNFNVYALMMNEEEITKYNYLTLDDLNLDSHDKLYTGGEILELLAKICILPNGNYIVSNVQDYISVIERVTYNDKREFFFRGHYYYKYLLVPSLYRKKAYYENESIIYMDFKTQFYNELSKKTYIEILTTMQHFRMPTRLLDTTSNPLVALFMACDKPQSYKNNKNFGIGEVIVMAEDVKNVKYSDSNVITLLSSLAVLETDYKQELYEKIVESLEKNDKSIYQNSLAYKRFVAEVYNELPYFDESFFTPEVLLKPRHVKVGMINERIIAQSGNFILFGLCNYKTGEYNKLNTVIKPRIFVVSRDKILKQLEMLNITTGTMYPDKDHVSYSILKKYEFLK